MHRRVRGDAEVQPGLYLWSLAASGRGGEGSRSICSPPSFAPAAVRVPTSTSPGAERGCLEGLLQRLHREIDVIEGRALEGQELQEARRMIALTNALDQFLGMETSGTPVAPLPDEEVAKIQRLEHELSDDLDEEVLLGAPRSWG